MGSEMCIRDRLSGDHKKIAEWREKKAIEITKNTRPDLWKLYKNTESRKK